VARFEYQHRVLAAQMLLDDGVEMPALQAHRAKVEGLLRPASAMTTPTSRYGGSKGQNSSVAPGQVAPCSRLPRDCVQYGPRLQVGDSPAYAPNAQLHSAADIPGGTYGG
jgi:hypothetical protein